jgi:hypothetical protein
MYLFAIPQFLLCQEAQSGVAPSYIEIYIRDHHGADSTQLELLCRENATQTLVSKIILFQLSDDLNIILILLA